MDYRELAEVLKSIGHPERIAIFNMLLNCKQNRMEVKSIYQELNIGQPIASRHLGIMKRAGLLRRENMNRKTFYSINSENWACVCVQRMFFKTNNFK